MQLQLSIFAQNLQSIADDGCSPFAVVAEAYSDPNKEPKIIGKTEVLKNTVCPDFTKIFLLHDFELGKPMNILVTMHDAHSRNESLGSVKFDIGTVLGTKGGVLGKQIRSGGFIMAHVERASGLGFLNLRLRGVNLVSKQEQVDPYFEIRKKRTTAKGKVVWDVVYRSLPVEDSTDPIWNDACIELSTLCGGRKGAQFRISVRDYDDSDDTLIGSFQVNVNKLLAGVSQGADTENAQELNLEKAFTLKKKPKRETGHVVVVEATITDTQPEDEIVVASEADAESDAVSQEEDIILEATNDIEILPEEVKVPNFADYIGGGCQLRVMVAIDYTASNGNPRMEDSLHFFKEDGLNSYQLAIKKICTILSGYDSDQKYPVWGFGAKKDGSLSNCFPVGGEDEVDGVDGILTAYKQAFTSGIVMSKPTNITEVTKAAGTYSTKCLETAMESGSQEYSILIIFTNGNVHNVNKTVAAIEETKKSPLSIVIVGVGPSDFSEMSFLNDIHQKGGRVQFVDVKAYTDDTLTEATLKNIPNELVAYFVAKGIKPNPPIETDEIVVEPFNEEEETFADIAVSDTGEIQVTTDTKPQSQDQNEAPTDGPGNKQSTLGVVGEKGKSIFMSQASKQFGRVSKTMQRNLDRMVDMQVNKFFGISGGKGGRKQGAKKNTRRKT